MGRIKTAFVKRISDQLIKKFKERFSDNFEENKKVVNEIVDYPSKKVKNQIAGYITRKIKKMNKGEIYE
jgi:small subunit ribosomal protein S17e